MSIKEFYAQTQHQESDDLVAACSSPTMAQWQGATNPDGDGGLMSTPWDAWA